MGISSGSRIMYNQLQSLNFTDLSGNYAELGTPFDFPVSIIKVNNRTDVNLVISFDGVIDHDIAPTGSAHVFDYGSNRTFPAEISTQEKGTQVWVKEEGAPASSGRIYLTAIYLKGNNP